MCEFKTGPLAILSKPVAEGCQTFIKELESYPLQSKSLMKQDRIPHTKLYPDMLSKNLHEV